MGEPRKSTRPACSLVVRRLPENCLGDDLFQLCWRLDARSTLGVSEGVAQGDIERWSRGVDPFKPEIRRCDLRPNLGAQGLDDASSFCAMFGWGGLHCHDRA